MKENSRLDSEYCLCDSAHKVGCVAPFGRYGLWTTAGAGAVIKRVLFRLVTRRMLVYDVMKFLRS